MFQNATQFMFSALFILSLGIVWGILYQIYIKATLQERQAKRPASPPPTDQPPTDQP